MLRTSQLCGAVLCSSLLQLLRSCSEALSSSRVLQEVIHQSLHQHLPLQGHRLSEQTACLRQLQQHTKTTASSNNSNTSSSKAVRTASVMSSG